MSKTNKNMDMKKYAKDYYNTNKEKLLEKALEKTVCEECGAIVCNSYLSTHKKGKLHDRKIAKFKMLQNKDIKKKLDKLNKKK